MFLVKAHGKVHEFLNSPDDDFIQFLPKHFGCAFEELEICLVPDDIEKDLRRLKILHGAHCVRLVTCPAFKKVSIQWADEANEPKGLFGFKKKKAATELKRVTKFPYEPMKQGKFKFLGIK
jgi:hypothetical protein